MAAPNDPWARAALRRKRLVGDPETTAFRWLNGEGDGVPAVTVDGFGGVCVLSLYRSFTPDQEREMAARAREHFGARSVYLKRRPKEAHAGARDREWVAPPLPVAGEPCPEWEALEAGLRYRIRPGDGLAVGLYLDMREVRGWLRRRAKGLSVLNTFAYTCGLGLSARVGAASRVVNLDASKRVLDWGAENAALNHLTIECLVGESFDTLRRLARKGERFDLVVLDPPSFSAAKGRRFSAAKDYGSLVVAALSVLAPKGLLLACCNLASLKPGRFEAQLNVSVAEAGRTVKKLERLGASPIDFPLAPGEIPGLKVAAATLD